VDLVLKKLLTLKTESGIMQNYEESRKIQNADSGEAVESSSSRDNVALQGTNVVSGESGGVLRGGSGGDRQGVAEAGDNIERQEQGGQAERQIQGRLPKHPVPADDRKGQVRRLWGDDEACGASQERGASGQSSGEPANSLRKLPQPLPQKTVVEAPKIVCITDPPYGIKRDKGFEGFGGFGEPIARRQYADDWDSERPDIAVFEEILRLAKLTIIFGGNYFADILPQSTHWLVWDKMNTMPTFGDCELMWTSSKR